MLSSYTNSKYIYWTINWTLWTTDDAGRAVKITSVGTVSKCVQILESKLPHFLKHVFIKREQSKYFESIKLNTTDQYCLLQYDYSENFSTVHQNGIQLAHFSKKQLSLFTAHVWAGAQNYSYVLVFNNQTHNKHTVSQCLDHIFTHSQSSLPNPQEIVIFSDGSASQFKQRFLFKNLTTLARDFNFLLSCHFFATSHGKVSE
ncbi:unnamed protein product [Didymodactylos carnosus]|uniref:Uncharacterized protein n=1 Tax=Didymodactylos carnosus TaxID=1234261 RepID=A0A814GA79_9BILA|nr:unnamed protein product [Didymodactylos carnosus]CAF1084069.1 unnamed protein product [Didymodactylos carnosus]CAF3764161.1 unnamed protein product [Didymodactylos carnosus]CAF3846651.1 unnamed protein product [Didymodactylos carnosus]